MCPLPQSRALSHSSPPDKLTSHYPSFQTQTEASSPESPRPHSSTAIHTAPREPSVRLDTVYCIGSSLTGEDLSPTTDRGRPICVSSGPGAGS